MTAISGRPEQVALEAEGLRKAYRGVEAVRGVSFRVRRGEVFALLGPNGAGKTTTLEMIEGMLPIGGGRAVVGGVDVAADPRAVRRMVGIQLQRSAFFDRLTLGELLELFGQLYGTRVDPTALLARVGLAERAGATVRTLSGGQQQRFGLAVALVNDPLLLILDEPTTGLDPDARRRVWELIAAARDEGRAVVLTTHYMEEAERLADRVAIMDRGRLVAEGRPRDLIAPLVAVGAGRPGQPGTLEDVFLELTGRRPEGG